ncbi:putative oxidoreductase,short chain dehydrogenase [Cladophialophora carrionii]|uniref:Putative oxidoreductase,short chain dehydrogenase n=1 Tax=Cladophialophora carrionii TaxID=86049 RepID=A0A1C1CCU1_9EURO|nr:putative oxidoreductase,short chain dehydrogenase [Cladophialophora carrionii]
MSEVTLPPPSVLTERLHHSKVVLVTGAASGIGFAAAQLFAQHGAKVILVDLASSRLEAAAEEIGHGCDFRACDVTKWEQQVALFDWVKHTYGPPEIVCLNAGIDPELATSENPSAKEKVVSNYLASESEPREGAGEDNSQLKQPPTTVLDVNFYGVLYGIKLAVHHFSAGKGGRVVITGSAASHMPVVY